jgi:phosphoglucosamine mutase
VGDRYVVEAMRAHGAVFGGEQSGHLVFMEHSTTGDGILAALQIMRIMVRKRRPLSELARMIEPFPQMLENVHVNRKRPFEEVPAVQKAVQEAEKQLDGRGRVLLRYSGTEAVARVMVEAEDRELMSRVSTDLVEAVRRGLA